MINNDVCTMNSPVIGRTTPRPHDIHHSANEKITNEENRGLKDKDVSITVVDFF